MTGNPHSSGSFRNHFSAQVYVHDRNGSHRLPPVLHLAITTELLFRGRAPPFSGSKVEKCFNVEKTVIGFGSAIVKG